jgi:hypothetical protein
MLFSYPGDEITTGISMTNEDGGYPATNAIDDSPVTGGVSRPLMSTTTSTTITLTGPSSVAQGVFLVNLSDMAGATVTWSGGGASSVPITIPARDPDGHGNNAWLDLRPYTSAATSWTLTITGAPTNVAIGRIFLTSGLRDLGVVTNPKFRAIRPDVVLKTIGGKNFVYDKGIRNRSAELTVRQATELAKLRTLWYSAKGRSLPWPLVPWDDRNDALWVTFSEAEHVWAEPEGTEVAESTVKVEQWMGLPL